MTGSLQAHEQINMIKKRSWTEEEDQKLRSYMKGRDHKRVRWIEVPKVARLNRCRKSCRERWTKYLRPDIKSGNFSPGEANTIINLQSVYGNSWAFIATHLPGRTDNAIKNLWNTRLKKLVDAQLPNPQPQLHELGFNSADPAQAVPPQGRSFYYQTMADMCDPVYNCQDQFGILFGNIHPASQKLLLQRLPATADWLDYGVRLNSVARLPNTHLLHHPVVLQGLDDIIANRQAQLYGVGFISTEPSQTLPSIHNCSDEPGPLFAKIPNERSAPAVLVSDSPERSRANQVVENEVTPAEESTESKACLEFARAELLMDGETSESLPGDLSRDDLDSWVAELGSLIANIPNAFLART